VLTLVLDEATGTDAASLVEERVRRPLGLDPLAFVVDDPGRLATAYGPDDDAPVDLDPGGFREPPPAPLLGGGLVATAGDVLRVLDELREPRTIGRASAEAIRSDQLSQDQRASADMLDEGESWGFQVGVLTAERPRRGSAGTFGWMGGTGCTAACDPRAGWTAVLLTNQAMGAPVEPASFAAFWDHLLAV
jgi:CubicO group peptidase (beta-lactamase class C family)